MAFLQLVQISHLAQELSGMNIEAQTKYAAPFSNVSMKKCPLSQLWKAPLGAHVVDPHTLVSLEPLDHILCNGRKISRGQPHVDCGRQGG